MKTEKAEEIVRRYWHDNPGCSTDIESAMRAQDGEETVHEPIDLIEALDTLAEAEMHAPANALPFKVTHLDGESIYWSASALDWRY